MDAVKVRDMYMAQGAMLVLLLMSILINLVVDILYGVIDPRVRFGYARGKS